MNVKRKVRRRKTVPGITSRYWKGDPPPKREPTAEDRALVIGAHYFGDDRPDEGFHDFEYHPHGDEWLAWVRLVAE